MKRNTDDCTPREIAFLQLPGAVFISCILVEFYRALKKSKYDPNTNWGLDKADYMW